MNSSIDSSPLPTKVTRERQSHSETKQIYLLSKKGTIQQRGEAD